MINIPKPAFAARNVAPPQETGAYFWWFRETATDDIFTPDMFETLHWQTVRIYEGFALLYLGVAKGQTLESRILGKHLGPSAHVSTVRHSIGALIANRLGLPRDEGAGSGKFAVDPGQELEKKISAFLTSNAMLSWIRHSSPRDIERELLGDYRKLSLPLNIKSNASHPFCPTLSSLRRKYARQKNRR